MIIIEQWKEPTNGTAIWGIGNQNEQELNYIKRCIAYIEEQAGREYGNTIPRFDIAHIGGTGAEKCDDPIAMLKRESRYNESKTENWTQYGDPMYSDPWPV